MTEVLLGNDALLYFADGDGNWWPYACCESFEVSVTSTTKSVKTVGDGIWGRERTQRLDYTVTASGIIRYDTEDAFNNFDLLEYQIGSDGIEWKAVYKQMDHSTEFTMLYGTILITETSFAAPQDFVNGSFSARGVGELGVGIMPTCTAEISDMTVTRNGILLTYSVVIEELVSGTVPSYEWQLDGGGVGTALSTGWQINVADTGTPYGPHVLEIWPVCSNGIRGVKWTENFTTTL
jgi:hypothetical protein